MLYNIINDVLSHFPKNTNFYSNGAKHTMAKEIATKLKEEINVKLSNQAMGAVMMALQKSLLEQTDIVPVLKSFEFELTSTEELTVKNPPNFKLANNNNDNETFSKESESTTGSD
jgi:hypothetical protein